MSECGILNISQPYRPPRPLMEIALLFNSVIGHNSFLSYVLQCNTRAGRPKGPEFQSWQSEEFSPVRLVQTGSDVNPAFSLTGTQGPLPGNKAAGHQDDILLSTSVDVDLYIHSPIHLNGVVLN
jgi:hypothetical protein